MPALDSLIGKLETMARKGGATALRQVEPKDVVVAQWVRAKCQFGCGGFSKNFTCPPYSPTPEETAATLQHYSTALLIEFANQHHEQIRRASPGRSQIQKTLYAMERAAFLAGYERAFVYKSGPCWLCKECPAATLEAPDIFAKKECRHPKAARPAMEAAGIDVFSTVRKAGFELHVVRDRTEPFKCFGLLLLE